jgi:hypothetical protein
VSPAATVYVPATVLPSPDENVQAVLVLTPLTRRRNVVVPLLGAELA